MKQTTTMALAGAIIWLAGCASPPRVAVLEPIGPSPRPARQDTTEGFLQVYSARTRTPPAADMAAWQWDSEFGRNQVPRWEYNPAHSDYAIYGVNGSLVKRVRNARDPSDGRPALVSLPPGNYEVRAEAEEGPGAMDIQVRVPVVVRAGQTTTAHLAGGWTPRRHYTQGEVVRLPNGQIAGWLAQEGAIDSPLPH